MSCWLLFENPALDRLCDCCACLLRREQRVHLQWHCLGCNGGCWGSSGAGCSSEEGSDNGAGGIWTHRTGTFWLWLNNLPEVCSFFAYCLCCRWFMVGLTEGPRQIAQEETSLIPYLCLSLIPNGNSWDQESIIFFVRINLGVLLFLCCHKWIRKNELKARLDLSVLKCHVVKYHSGTPGRLCKVIDGDHRAV